MIHRLGTWRRGRWHIRPRVRHARGAPLDGEPGRARDLLLRDTAPEVHVVPGARHRGHQVSSLLRQRWARFVSGHFFFF